MKFNTGDIVQSIHSNIIYLVNDYLKDKKAYQCTVLDGTEDGPQLGIIRWVPGKDLEKLNADLCLSYYKDEYSYLSSHRGTNP